MVAPAGAGAWPQMTVGASAPARRTRMGRSPSGPLRWGSTTWRVKPAAQAASAAVPPASSVLMATAEASQWVVVATPKVPAIWGRVVKVMLGLPLDARSGAARRGDSAARGLVQPPLAGDQAASVPAR